MLPHILRSGILSSLLVLWPLLAGAQVSNGHREVEKTDTLNASRVTADKLPRDESATQTGLQRIDASKIHRGFALFNSPDIIKTLQNLPGVAAGTELMSGIYVHGGDGNDNLFLLDGVPIYQVSHLIGLFSSFNSDVVESLDFYKSGFPARYGGRASSVVDVSTKSGDFHEYHGLAAIGLIDGRLHVEGPIVKGRTSFNFGLRRTWLDMVTTPALWYANRKSKEEYGKEEASIYSGGYNFTDLNLGITHRIAHNNTLRLNFYSGDDKARFKVKEPQTIEESLSKHFGYNEISAKITWGNTLASLNWKWDISEMLHMNATAYHSRNRSFIGAGIRMWEWTGKDEYSTLDEDIKAYVNVTGLKADFHLYPDSRNHIRLGAMLQLNSYLPGRAYRLSYAGMGELGQSGGNSSNHYSGLETAVYAEDEISFTSWLKANLGARGVMFAVQGKNWLMLEPRASLKFQCGENTSIRMSYTEMNQFDHSLSTSYLDLPTNTWMPSTAVIKPVFSRQFAAGVYSMPGQNIKLSAEGWYKTMKHLYEYGGMNTLYPPIESWESEFVEGQGKSWGLETGFEYETDKLTAEVYYTLSWSMRKYDDFYYDWYPDRNDNRHKLDILLNYRPKPKFELFAGWHYHTGSSLTAATYRIQPDSDHWIDKDIYDRPNSLKLPDYHRLDVGFNWYRPKKDGRQAIWNLSIYNAYCRMNAVTASLKEETVKTITPEGEYRVEPTGRIIGEAIGIIPIIPTLGYTFKF